MSNPEADHRSELRASALRWRRAFPGDDAQIAALRRWLEWLLPPCSSRDDLMSVAVELGTIAVRHTASGSGGQFLVEVTRWMQMTRVAVHDDGGLNSPRVAEDLLSEDGRGLLMVNALSVRMGVGGNAQGRVVWADIRWTGQDIPNQLEFPELTSASYSGVT
jgi:serine/threonine-protein kinase RsbW